MVISKILGIFLIVFVGFGANKAGWIPVSASKYLSNIVIKLAAPCVVINVMSDQQLNSGSLHVILLIFAVSASEHLLGVPLGMLAGRIMKIPADQRGIYKNFLIFSNNGFMGLPVALAMFGPNGMFYMVIANGVMNILLFTLGIGNLRSGKNKGQPFGEKLRASLKSVFDVPIIALIIGFALLAFQIRLPGEVRDVLTSVGNMMAPLSMIVVGLQLTSSRPREVISNYRLLVVAALRLLIIPGFFFSVMYICGASPLFICVLTLSAMLPCATVPVALAEAEGRDSKLAAEGTFLSTLFSMATLPIGGLLLSSLL